MDVEHDNVQNDPADLAWLSTLLSLSGPLVGLQPGMLGGIAFHILADLARIRNPRMLNALEKHLVQGWGWGWGWGWARDRSCAMYGVNLSNFSRRVAEMNRTWLLIGALRTLNDKTGSGPSVIKKENTPDGSAETT